MRRGILIAVTAVVACAPVAQADDGTAAIDRGRALLSEKCAQCHAIGAEGESPLAAAPHFRDLHKRYPIEGLAEALAEGIATGHSAMPQFAFEPAEIDAILSYLNSLAPPP